MSGAYSVYPLYLTRKGVTAAFGIPRTELDRIFAAGGVRIYKGAGGAAQACVVFNVSDILAWLDAHSTRGGGNVSSAI